MSITIQSESNECGLACIAIVCRIRGAAKSLADLRNMYAVSDRGQSLADLMDIARSLNFNPRAVKCDIEDLRALTLPAIIHWSMNHFVVLTKIGARSAVIEDPAIGRRVISFRELSRSFSGVALELSPNHKFRKRRVASEIGILSLIKWDRPIVMGLIQTVILSIVVQAYVLAAPLYIQLAVDEAALKGDHGLLNIIALGFLLFCIFNVVAEFLREWASQRVSALISWGMTTAVYGHLVRLPLRWFQKRKLADTITRFDSIQPIKELISRGLVTSLIDGVLSVTIIVIMFISAWKLAALSLLSLALYVAIKLSTLGPGIRLAAHELMARINEEGSRIETVSAIQSVKASAAEDRREGEWSGKMADLIKSSQSHALFRSSISATESFISLGSYIVIVYVGVVMFFDASMTIGSLVAFLAYRQQFHDRAVAMVDFVINWKLLDVHTDRLSDIVLERPEELKSRGNRKGIIGKLSLDKVGFHYGGGNAVFSGVCIDIMPGEFIAIVGESGSGKTTLIKVMSSLYAPSVGVVRVDDQPIGSLGVRDFRMNVGTVLQEDELFSGTIIDNVTMFDEMPDVVFVEECLQAASIYIEVKNFPLGINTVIGDMGGGLSSGQKQRLLIARALYRRPSIIFLDEATSHLDRDNEEIVIKALNRMNITRVVAAHRKETIAMADRVILLGGGVARVLKPASHHASP